VNWLIRVLKEKSDGFGFRIWAYCYMPDHLHLLIEGKNSDSDLKRFIASYKQFTGYYHRKEKNLSLWQVNFHEHILRKDEDTKRVAYYIFGNPVRKGLVRDYREYEFLGSFEFDVAQP
jgi:putative transposase